MAFSLITNTSAAGLSAVTTPAVNTTGADLLVIGLACDPTYATTPTDSKGNTWTKAATDYTNTVEVQLWYSVPTTVGTSHTFTAPGAVVGSIFVQAFSGAKQTSPLDQQTGNTAVSTTIQAGSITPSNDNSLLVGLMGISAAGAPMSIDGGFTETNEQDFVGGTNYGGAMSYLIQTTATAANPTFTRTNSDLLAATLVSFDEAVAGGLANVKTINGLAVASTKAINGLAIANVASVNGVT